VHSLQTFSDTCKIKMLISYQSRLTYVITLSAVLHRVQKSGVFSHDRTLASSTYLQGGSGKYKCACAMHLVQTATVLSFIRTSLFMVSYFCSLCFRPAVFEKSTRFENQTLNHTFSIVASHSFYLSRIFSYQLSIV